MSLQVQCVRARIVIVPRPLWGVARPRQPQADRPPSGRPLVSEHLGRNKQG